uniref:RNI-like protein n=1 Tax=Kalmanozyma brasiliensis (strain GHG001) TaxID=1365824 RepID=V5ER07_KALBG
MPPKKLSISRIRADSRPKVSARILHILEDDIEETRVQNLFAPDPPSFLVAHLSNALASARDHRPSILSEATAEDIPLAALPSRLVLAQPATFALRSLQLHGLTRLQDGTLARFFEAAIPSASNEAILRLDTISLKGCISIGDRTVTAICRSTGSSLRYINLDFTDITADSVFSIMSSIPDLHTLKLGFNDNLSDKALQLALAAPATGVQLPFSKLTNLRLRHCPQVGDQGVASFLKHCFRSIEVLDISHTGVGGNNAHQPDLSILLMSLFPMGVPDEPTGPLKKLNLLGTNIDYFTLRTIVDRNPGIHTLLLRQMPSPNSRDGLVMFLEKLAIERQSWRHRGWKRLHLKISDVGGDAFGELFPDLLAIFPRLTVEGLKTSMSQTAFFHAVPEKVQGDQCIVRELKLPDAKLSDHAWSFLPKIRTLRSLDVSNTAVPEQVVKETIENNEFLETIDLSHCKQMRIGTRRNAFDLVKE